VIGFANIRGSGTGTADAAVEARGFDRGARRRLPNVGPRNYVESFPGGARWHRSLVSRLRLSAVSVE